MLHPIAQAHRQRVELRQTRGVRLTQGLDAECCGLQQARRMGQARIVLLQGIPLRHVKTQAIHLVALKLQRLALGGHRIDIFTQTDAAAAQCLPIVIQGCDLFRSARHARITIQQHTLRIGAHQRLMRVLSVYIQQLIARFAQLLQGGTSSVDEAARTSPGIQHATQQTYTRIAFQLLLAQPCL